MKKFLLISLICLVHCGFSQTIGSFKISRSDTPSYTYTAIPSCPTFTSPFLLEQATTGTSITSGELGGDTELIIDETPGYDFIQWNGLTGTTRQFQSESQSNDPGTWSIVGRTGTGGSMTSVNNTSDVEFYCLKVSNRSQGIGTWDASPSGPNFTSQNIIIYNTNAAGYQANSSNPGVDIYGNWNITFNRFRDQGDETVYFGSTTATPNQTVFQQFIFNNNYADSAQWDLAQFSGVMDLRAEKITFRHGGLDGTIGQDRALQLQNVRGYFRDFILDSAGNVMNIAANSLRIANGFIKYARDAFGTQVDMSDNNLTDTAVLTATSTTSNDIPTSHPTNVTFTLAEGSRGYVTGELLLIRNDNTHYFYGTVDSYSDPSLTITSEYNVGTGNFSSWDVSGLVLYDSLTIYNENLTQLYIMQINEDNCSIIAKDCVIPTACSSFFDDNRGSSTWLLTEINTTFDDSPPTPEYTDPPEAEWAEWEQVIIGYWYTRRCGHRTP